MENFVTECAVTLRSYIHTEQLGKLRTCVYACMQ